MSLSVVESALKHGNSLAFARIQKAYYEWLGQLDVDKAREQYADDIDSLVFDFYLWTCSHAPELDREATH